MSMYLRSAQPSVARTGTAVTRFNALASLGNTPATRVRRSTYRNGRSSRLVERKSCWRGLGNAGKERASSTPASDTRTAFGRRAR